MALIQMKTKSNFHNKCHLIKRKKKFKNQILNILVKNLKQNVPKRIIKQIESLNNWKFEYIFFVLFLFIFYFS